MDDDEECDDSSDSPESEIMDANQLQVSDFFFNLQFFNQSGLRNKTSMKLQRILKIILKIP